MNDIMVSVCVLSYNHEKYLRDCLEGIVMQKTTFPIEVWVHDDASTDSSPDIIRAYQNRYPNVIKPILQTENQYSKRQGSILSRFVFPKCTGKYIALCEGDDYWTDPLKLQKQVDFLEGHEEYSMCFHSAILLNECDAKVTSSYSIVKEGDYGPNDIFPRWVVPTASVVFSREKFDSYNLIHTEWFVFGDIVIFERCAHVGKLWGFEERMSVYRMNGNSVLQDKKYQDPRLQAMPFHFKALKMNFPLINKKVLNQLIADSYYAKMRNDSHVLEKGIDFFRFVFASPSYSTQKLLGKFLK